MSKQSNEVTIMRILICDDDLPAAEQLQTCLQQFFSKNKLKSPDIVIYPNGESLLADQNSKDIVFLDIEMPGLSGIFVGNELKKANKNIIIFIITSYVEYLDEAMRFHVFRYLSKPLDRQRLFRNMKDAIQLYNTSATKILIETKQGCFTIFASEIILIESHARKVTVHTAKCSYESIHNMKYWMEALTMHCFFPTHKSFIVNLEHVSDFNHSLIHLHNNQFEAYLTRRKYTQFKEAYLLYLESIR